MKYKIAFAVTMAAIAGVGAYFYFKADPTVVTTPDQDDTVTQTNATSEDPLT